jgi:hypothetical protein
VHQRYRHLQMLCMRQGNQEPSGKN